MLGLNKKRRNTNASRVVVGLEFQQEGLAVVINHGVAGSFECVFELAKDNAEDRLLRLKALVKKYHLQGVATVISMLPNDYSLLQMRSPAMSLDELRASMKWRIKELVDYSSEETVVDVFEFPESGQRGAERLMYVAATRVHLVQNAIDTVKKSGLNLVAVDIGELSLRNIVSRLPNHDSGVVALYLSKHSGLLVFTKGDELYLARRLEFGVESYLSSNEDKRNQISEQIFLEIQRSLDYFEGHFSQPLPAKLFVFPGIKVVQPLIDQIRSNLSLTVEGVILENALTDINNLTEQQQSYCVLAAGAALRDIEGLG